MIKFEKVPFDEYYESRLSLDPSLEDNETTYNNILFHEYHNIKLPTRGTAGSAGYDFFAPFTIYLQGPTADFMNRVAYHYQVIPTGIRWICDRKDVVLVCLPRSGLGFKYGTKLKNSTGIIDCDYFKADNFGHIKLSIAAETGCTIEAGKGMMQGIIMPFILTDDDTATADRVGGFGSTDKKENN